MIHTERTSTNWKENTGCEFAKCPIIGKDLQNFIIESTNRDSDKKSKYKKKGWIYVPLELLKGRSRRLGTDTVGIAHEIRRQTMANGPPLLFSYSLLTRLHPLLPFFSGNLCFPLGLLPPLAVYKKLSFLPPLIHHFQTPVSPEFIQVFLSQLSLCLLYLNNTTCSSLQS